MSLFFTVFGAIFIGIFATVTHFIYDIFPINRITSLLHPINRGTWSKINAVVLPILLWGIVELPILGTHQSFILSIVLSIFLSCSIMYVIVIGENIFLKKETKIARLISIYIGILVSQTICYLLFSISQTKSISIWISIGTLLLLLITYYITIIYPPKTNFFNGPK